MHHSTERLLIDAIEAGGVTLIVADTADGVWSGPGVRLKRPT